MNCFSGSDKICETDSSREISNVIDDLSGFTGLEPSICAQRLSSLNLDQLAAEWQTINPQTNEEIYDFYQSTDVYIWELAAWNLHSERQPIRDHLKNLVNTYPVSKGYTTVLDYGAGIGSDSLFLSGEGYHTILADVAGTTQEFAKHRFKRRSIPCEFVVVNSDTQSLGVRYDIAVCFDVIEHVPDPEQIISLISKGLRPGGILLINWPTEEDELRPCHLQRNIDLFNSQDWRLLLEKSGLECVGDITFKKRGKIRQLLHRAKHCSAISVLNRRRSCRES